MIARFSRQVKDPETINDAEDVVKSPRIVTPSRTILPPHSPHFIYFNPGDSVNDVTHVNDIISPTPVRLTNTAPEPGVHMKTFLMKYIKMKDEGEIQKFRV